jgi:hypothetical protein
MDTNHTKTRPQNVAARINVYAEKEKWCCLEVIGETGSKSFAFQAINLLKKSGRAAEITAIISERITRLEQTPVHDPVTIVHRAIISYARGEINMMQPPSANDILRTGEENVDRQRTIELCCCVAMGSFGTVANAKLIVNTLKESGEFDSIREIIESRKRDAKDYIKSNPSTYQASVDVLEYAKMALESDPKNVVVVEQPLSEPVQLRPAIAKIPEVEVDFLRYAFGNTGTNFLKALLLEIWKIK